MAVKYQGYSLQHASNQARSLDLAVSCLRSLLWILTTSFSPYSGVTRHPVSGLLASSSPSCFLFPSSFFPVSRHFAHRHHPPSGPSPLTANSSSPALDLSPLPPSLLGVPWLVLLRCKAPPYQAALLQGISYKQSNRI